VEKSRKGGGKSGKIQKMPQTLPYNRIEINPKTWWGSVIFSQTPPAKL